MRFGSDCAAVLGGDMARAVKAQPALFNTGTHGPDLLFYRLAPIPNRISICGSRLHHESARGFFERARAVWDANGDREAMLAYLLGFLTHFALDSACHGFVNAECARLGVTHNRLEAVWDSRMMLRDNRKPSLVYRGEGLEATREGAAVIARFYGISARQALEAMRGQKRVMRLLRVPAPGTRRLLRSAIRALRLPGDFDDLFIDDELPAALIPALDTLDGLYAGALEEYPAMAEAVLRFLDEGEPLPERFERDFE